MPQFRDFLADWLIEHGWSANRLAEETGIAQTLVSRYLHPDPNRRIRPTDQTLRKLAPVVGRSHDDLMRMAGRLDTSSEAPPPEPDDAEMLALLRRVPDEDRPTLKSIVRKFAVAPVTKPYRRRVTDVDTDFGRANDDKRRPIRPRESQSVKSMKLRYGFQPAY